MSELNNIEAAVGATLVTLLLIFAVTMVWIYDPSTTVRVVFTIIVGTYLVGSLSAICLYGKFNKE